MQTAPPTRTDLAAAGLLFGIVLLFGGGAFLNWIL